MKVYRYSVCFGWPRYNQPRPTRKGKHAKTPAPRYQPSPNDQWIASWLEQQLELAHDYGERHVNIELYRRERYRELYRQYSPTLATLYETISDLDQQIEGEIRKLKRRNQQANAQNIRANGSRNGKKIVAIDENDCQELEDLKDKRRQAYEAFRVAEKELQNKTAKPTLLTQLEEEWAQVVADNPKGLSKRTIGSWKGKKGKEALGKQPVHIQRQWLQLQEARQTWLKQYPFRSAVDALDQEMKLIKKRLYNTSGLAWDTAGQVDNDAKRLASGPPPRHHRYDGQGALTIQIKGGGLAVGDLLSGVSEVARLETLRPLGSEHRRQRNQEKGRPNAYLMELIVRVNTPEGDAKTSAGLQRRPRGDQRPILRIPFVLHRPLPTDGVVKRIKLVRKLEGAQFVLDLQFVVDADDDKVKATTGAVGVTLCQRKVGDQLWLAVAKSDDGQTHILKMSEVMGDEGRDLDVTTIGNTTTYTLWGALDLWKQADDLQACLDKIFEDTKGQLDDYIQSEWDGKVPSWLQEAMKGCDEPWWRQHHLLQVFNLWEQYGPKDFLYEALKEWRGEDWKLYTAMRGTAAKAERVRLDLYRKFAAYLAMRYHTVIVPDTDYASMKRNPEVGDPDVYAAWRRYSKIASLGLLRECLTQRAACGEKVKAKLVCSYCGGKTSAQDENTVVCKSCGAEHGMLEATAYGLLAASGKAIKTENQGLANGKRMAGKDLQPEIAVGTSRKT